MSTLAFDIEVAGHAWEEIDEITRGYLLARERDPGRRDAVPERTALYPGLGKVIAVGMWSVEEDRGLLLLEGERESAMEREWEKVSHSKIFHGGERELLEMFWTKVARPSPHSRLPKLVSYNGRGYDGPVLMVRSAQHGLKPTRNLLPNRYRTVEHCDLMDVIGFFGASRERFSLDYWCRRFDIESPKGSIDGSQVGRAYREGRIEDIGEYCLRDVRATAELYRKLASTILPVMEN